ncbi:MAG: FAD:protein FMN transferase [Phycisphaerales bacterium]|nr:FAD:protein FMN transferase [Phycisphaerales bacterium]
MLVVLAWIVGCQNVRSSNRFTFDRVCMGTRATIRIDTDRSQASAEAAARAAFAVITAIEHDTSDWLVDGPVAALRTAQRGETVQLPEHLAMALRHSAPLVDLTAGAFDPVCGRVSSLWRAAREAGTPPDQTAMTRAASKGGFHTLGFDPQAGTVCPTIVGPWLDFGGIAKGMAADAALAEIASHGMPHAVVDVGGDLAVGRPATGAKEPAWIVGISGDVGVSSKVYVGNCGVATSGSHYQHIESADARLSHVFDPRTGRPVTDMRAFTVIAPTAAQADALASAACVMGPEAMQALLERSDIDATLHVSP